MRFLYSQKEAADFLDNWEVFSMSDLALNDQFWLYEDDISRQDTVTLLSQHPEDGTFLIRKSMKKKNCFVLSTICEKTCTHFFIESRGIYVFLEEGPYMASLSELVDHYSRFSDGLPCRLTYPLLKMISDIPRAPDVPPR